MPLTGWGLHRFFWKFRKNSLKETYQMILLSTPLFSHWSIPLSLHSISFSFPFIPVLFYRHVFLNSSLFHSSLLPVSIQVYVSVFWSLSFPFFSHFQPPLCFVSLFILSSKAFFYLFCPALLLTASVAALLIPRIIRAYFCSLHPLPVCAQYVFPV